MTNGAGAHGRAIRAVRLDGGDGTAGSGVRRDYPRQGRQNSSARDTVSLGAVYATLDRLEDKGFVASWLSDPTPERGGRAKRHYKLEAPGERALHESAVAAKRVVDHLEQLWGGDAWNPNRRWKPARLRS